MATDLREPQHKGGRLDAVRPHRDPRRGITWPYVATAIVLIVLTGISVLLLTQEAPQSPTSVEQWVASIEGMATETREGSGFSRPAGPVEIDVEAGAYAKGAMTSSRESSEAGSVEDLPDLMTEVREG